MTRRFLIFSVFALTAAACGGSDTPTSPSTGSAPFSTTDLGVGTGAEAQTGQNISVTYTGWLYSDTAAENKGLQFEPNPPAERASYQFQLGAGRVIRGWDQGIPGMRVGGRRRIVIPPELAYGSSANGPIPPNATILFEVELVSIP